MKSIHILLVAAAAATLQVPAAASTPSATPGQPVQSIPIAPASPSSAYVGQYAIDDRVVMEITERQGALALTMPGGPPEILMSRGNGRFTGRYMMIVFPPAKGPASKLIIRRYGLDIDAPRVSPQRAAKIKSQLQQRTLALQAGQPDSVVRELISEVVSGAPRYEQFTPTFRQVMQRRITRMQPFLAKMGSLRSVEFIEVGPLGMDIYRAVFERGTRRIFISTDAAGRVSGFVIRLPE